MLQQIIEECKEYGATLVAVSKTKSNEEILNVYNEGQRHFGENKVQELVLKREQLPKNIQWHLIGHLQKNKVKYIAPFVYLIHSIDNEDLLIEVDKQAKKFNRRIPVLLQIKIAQEDSKFGLSESDAEIILTNNKVNKYPNVLIQGLMGMATYTDDNEQIRHEFRKLAQLKSQWATEYDINLSELSMGMSSDYHIALTEGSTMIRVGSLIFGER